MNKSELRVLEACTKRIRELASLERANFSLNDKKDDEIKKNITPYMMWFDIVADYLEELQKVAQEEDRYVKRWSMDRLLNDTSRYF